MDGRGEGAARGKGGGMIYEWGLGMGWVGGLGCKCIDGGWGGMWEDKRIRKLMYRSGRVRGATAGSNGMSMC